MRAFPHAECPDIMSLSADRSAHAHSPSDGARGSVTSTVARRLQPGTAHAPPKDKPILAAPMFVFQRMTSAMKRTVEEDGNGSCVNKRIRLLTYPSSNSRNRKEPCGFSKRVRSSSLSFPPPLQDPHTEMMLPYIPRSNVFVSSTLHNPNQVSSPAPSLGGKIKNTLLRPASLVAPHSHDVSCIEQVSLNADGKFSRVTIELQSSASALDQWMLPQMSRNLSQTNSAVRENAQFVFGENMSERVLSPPRSEDKSETDCSSTDSDSSCTEASNTMTENNTLWESAAAHTAASRRRCLLKQVQIFTGEENESNVIQLTCKLFVLERGTQSWSERGRGFLRLNDLQTKYKGCLQSRMVMRHQGSLKLILNTKLYPHTHLRRPARRNLQVTATDLETHSVRVFLVQASARDIARLYVAIHHRLVALRCSTAMYRDRDGHCSSEEDNDNNEEKANKEAVLIAHTRSGDCNWRNSHSRLHP
ncbi:ran-binding protein 3-like isoform X2 [Tachysurus fulvidraco]|uniref:ran-binding protein 3-like isoform X2 n=1 Tax=Tachysurus fulvidraco TaxID=1234273 RepID=UPI001FED9B65|nr:ran-binding protein 3-like isoform X2 [Tachysurus fulvidraco]